MEAVVCLVLLKLAIKGTICYRGIKLQSAGKEGKKPDTGTV